MVVIGGEGVGGEKLKRVGVLSFVESSHGERRLADMPQISHGVAAGNMGNGTIKTCGGYQPQDGSFTANCHDYDIAVGAFADS